LTFEGDLSTQQSSNVHRDGSEKLNWGSGCEDEIELDKVIVPNTGSSGGSYSGPHHRKFVYSSSGGVKQFIKSKPCSSKTSRCSPRASAE